MFKPWSPAKGISHLKLRNFCSRGTTVPNSVFVKKSIIFIMIVIVIILSPHPSSVSVDVVHSVFQPCEVLSEHLVEYATAESVVLLLLT